MKRAAARRGWAVAVWILRTVSRAVAGVRGRAAERWCQAMDGGEQGVGQYRFEPGVADELTARFARRARRGEAANGRDARTLFEGMVERQAGRLAAHERPARGELALLLADDIPGQ